MSKPGRYAPKSLLRKLWLVSLALLASLVISALVVPELPMGTGSVGYARRWSERFAKLNSVRDARAAFSEVRAREFENGEWIFFVSDNSHSNPWGGTVVTKDSHGRTKTLYGHVCGHVYIGEPKSLAEVYRTLSERYGTTPEEGARKTARLTK